MRRLPLPKRRYSNIYYYNFLIDIWLFINHNGRSKTMEDYFANSEGKRVVKLKLCNKQTINRMKQHCKTVGETLWPVSMTIRITREISHCSNSTALRWLCFNQVVLTWGRHENDGRIIYVGLSVLYFVVVSFCAGYYLVLYLG